MHFGLITMKMIWSKQNKCFDFSWLNRQTGHNLNIQIYRVIHNKYWNYPICSVNAEPPAWKWMDENLETNGNVNEFARLFIIEGKEIFDFINKTVLKGAHPICQLTTQKTAVYNFPQHKYVVCVTEGNDFNRPNNRIIAAMVGKGQRNDCDNSTTGIHLFVPKAIRSTLFCACH